MSIFALIGGKGNLPNPTNKIEEHLLKLSQKEEPLILYCPYATLKDIHKSIQKFHKLMEPFSCKIIDLTLENISSFEIYLKQCDIFYISGGCCDELVHFFKENGLDKILSKYIDSHIIFAGSSAGAMLFTKSAMGDKNMFMDNFHKWNYQMVDCLGFLNLTICPHYQEEDLILYNDRLKEYPYDAFGIEEDTMVVIKENKFYVVKEVPSKSVYFFERNKNYVMLPLYEGVEYEKDSSFRT